MKSSVAIDQLSLSEKIELMEKLWADITTSADYSPPQWHGEELQKRRDAVKEGKVSYTDWEKAKTEIRDDIS
jgi:putative addiction module component (TIGR02574 family)